MKEMEITVYRYNSDTDHSNGLMLIDKEFQCYTLEDEYRTLKVMGETRIPDGRYPIGFRTEGGFHERYKAKYGGWHKGMLEIKQVPNFKYILIHKGNDDDDTAGCLLVGSGNTNGANFISNSGDAYMKIYPKIKNALRRNERVYIQFATLDNPTN